MKNYKFVTASIVLIGCLVATPVAAKKGSLSSCQSLKNKISKYDKLRKAGGSAPRMESWKKARRSAQAKFSKLQCAKWKRELR